MNYPDDFMNKIICGDCLEVLKEIPDESIDMILADPPFMISREAKITRNRNPLKRMKYSGIVLKRGEYEISRGLR